MELSIDAVAGISPPLLYVLFFIGAILEGPVLSAFAGLLLKLGHVAFWPSYIALMAGDLAADSVWYVIGALWARPFIRRFGKFFSLEESFLIRVEKVFQNHPMKILFLSKITTGFGFAIAVLMTAGMARVPYRKYLIALAGGQLIWTGMLLLIGYFFGYAYELIDAGFRAASIFVFIILVLAAMAGLNRYFRRKNFLAVP